MCNEYARQLSLGILQEEFDLRSLAPFSWAGGRIPNDLDGTASVRIRDSAPVVRISEGRLVAEMMTWAWPRPRGKPVFNFVSEGRDFAGTDRVLILATGFYEYTDPADKRVKLKDRHLFTRPGEPWFWIVGIVKHDCFTMLTVAPGPDVAPYHDRQIVTLSATAGERWLIPQADRSDVLRSPPGGTFNVTTLRRDGRPLAT